MSMDLKGRHYITARDWSDEELEHALATAADLKDKFHRDEPTPLLRDKSLFALFFEQSTRTRNSMEAGMTQLGGHANILTPEKLQLSHGETVLDTGKVLSRMGHGIAIRNCDWGVGNAFMRDIAAISGVPVINLQCDMYHPCQALADIMTVRETFRDEVHGRKIVVSWTYAPSYVRPISVPHSEILMMARMGLDVTLAHPPEFKLLPEIVDVARADCARHGTNFEIVDDMDAGFAGAHVVYPKSWGCLVTEPDREAAVAHIEKYPGWICNEARMKLAAPDAVYMHPLPATRGQEVTDAVIDGPQSVVWDQAENRLHTAKALMALTM
ncbi:ornithine carbamoyltransferase [bacterium]|nr:ornithine carbamoyltransferase [bacterium]MBU1072751.1 ornithine carbamoyltransferase [bacterium]